MTKDFEIDGVSYHVWTTYEKGFWYGQWRKNGTKETGASSKPTTSEKEALKLGERNARSNYGFTEGRKK